ncbi:MAG: FkbM family methyltransferase [Deltaproteobacteria bacterium]|nr:FkbM family methyltransferase [Deltaproteobacteria bacterium]
MGSLLGVGATAGLTQGAAWMRAQADAANALDAADDSDNETGSGWPAPGETPPPPEDLGPMAPDGRQLSYAQQGEDLVVQAVLDRLGIKRPRYLDIGAFHPSIASNTYRFYVQGSRGVLVEPNPSMAALLRRARPQDVVLEVGVSVDAQTTADYYVVRASPQLNTFSAEQAERYIAEGGQGAIERVVKMPLRSIDDILDEHFGQAPPDLVSIDVEGLDLQLLQTMSFDRVRPAVLCVETLIYGTTKQREPIATLLAEHGYRVAAGTFVNTIFVDGRRQG